MSKNDPRERQVMQISEQLEIALRSLEKIKMSTNSTAYKHKTIYYLEKAKEAAVNLSSSFPLYGGFLIMLEKTTRKFSIYCQPQGSRQWPHYYDEVKVEIPLLMNQLFDPSTLPPAIPTATAAIPPVLEEGHQFYQGPVSAALRGLVRTEPPLPGETAEVKKNEILPPCDPSEQKKEDERVRAKLTVLAPGWAPRSRDEIGKMKEERDKIEFEKQKDAKKAKNNEEEQKKKEDDKDDEEDPQKLIEEQNKADEEGRQLG